VKEEDGNDSQRKEYEKCRRNNYAKVSALVISARDGYYERIKISYLTPPTLVSSFHPVLANLDARLISTRESPSLWGSHESEVTREQKEVLLVSEYS
jgi:hypothetical protein